jgi:membrane protein
MRRIRKIINVLKRAWEIFAANYPIEFASSFAYFSLFGLPSIFLIVILFLSLFFDPSLLYQILEEQLAIIIGNRSAELVVDITNNYLQQAMESVIAGVGYGITFFLLATQLMVFFQDILNDMWKIKPDFKNFWQKQLKERGLTFIMVLTTGLLIFVSQAFEQLLVAVSVEIMEEVKDLIVNVFTVLMVYLWFVVLYKFLPFVKIPWEPVWVGAIVTSILFFAGVWMLFEFAVKDQSLEDLYDEMTPIVLISFWIFYNSLAFLFGASFTKAYAEARGKDVKSLSYSYKYKLVKDE